ncbi:hypothetical protein HAX54_016005 [Datura stramonium]|uniref:Uncharacterized protein n=1 Tax=Datura stramonium TaxID=4076 RepID=A0ABS8S1V8_DATST|nr:hypothetical protein [Datura stramonium]
MFPTFTRKPDKAASMKQLKTDVALFGAWVAVIRVTPSNMVSDKGFGLVVRGTLYWSGVNERESRFRGDPPSEDKGSGDEDVQMDVGLIRYFGHHLEYDIHIGSQTLDSAPSSSASSIFWEIGYAKATHRSQQNIPSFNVLHKITDICSIRLLIMDSPWVHHILGYFSVEQQGVFSNFHSIAPGNS